MFLNGYPYTDFHELNLDFLLQSMEVLKKAFKDFTGANSLIFAEPLLHDLTKQYAKNTIVVDENGDAFISLQIVPAGILLSNSDYWLEVFDFEGYVSRANKNFTDNYFSNVDRSPVALSVGDWLVLDDVLYKVTVAIPVDGLFEVGVNIVHFTIEQFLKDFVTSINATVQQYKNDIDASELAYRQQLAQDIANTTANLQAQLDLAISGATVDSEVINARIGANGYTYSTLGDAIRTQIDYIGSVYTKANLNDGYYIKYSDGTQGPGGSYKTTDPITVNPGDEFLIATSCGVTGAAVAMFNGTTYVQSASIAGKGTAYTELFKIVIPSGVDNFTVSSNFAHSPHTLVIVSKNDFPVIYDALNIFDANAGKKYVQQNLNYDYFASYSDGSLTSSIGYVVTDPIPVSANDSFIIANAVGTAAAAVAMYNGNTYVQSASVIGRGSGNVECYKITIPSGVDNIRISSYMANSNSVILVSSPDYYPFIYSQLDNLMNVTIGQIYMKQTYKRAVYTRYSDGTEGPGSTYITSEDIPVSEGDEFIIVASCGSSAAAVAMYNGGTYVQSASIAGRGATDIDPFYVKVPSGVDTMKVCANMGYNPHALMVTSKNYYPLLFNIYKKALFNVGILGGKKILGVGDSLMYGNQLGPSYSWLNLLGNECGAITYNYGQNGNPVAGSGGMVTRIPDIYNNDGITDIDYFVLIGGANDKSQNVPLGSDDSTNINQFCGALNTIIDYVRQYWSQAHIVFMTNYDRFPTLNTLGLTDIDYVEAMQRICAKKHVFCYDNYHDSGVDFSDPNFEAWADEGIYLGGAANKHFSPDAYKWLLPKYKALLEAN